MRAVFYAADHDPVSNIPPAPGALMHSFLLMPCLGADWNIKFLQGCAASTSTPGREPRLGGREPPPAVSTHLRLPPAGTGPTHSALFYGYRNQVYLVSYKVVKRERAERVCGFLLNEAEAISSEVPVSGRGPGRGRAGCGEGWEGGGRAGFL